MSTIQQRQFKKTSRSIQAIGVILLVIVGYSLVGSNDVYVKQSEILAYNYQ